MYFRDPCTNYNYSRPADHPNEGGHQGRIKKIDSCNNHVTLRVLIFTHFHFIYIDECMKKELLYTGFYTNVM